MTPRIGLLLTVTAFILAGCNEPAATWSDKRPAECSWKEIERDGDWQQTCDDNQKRLQR